MMNHESVSQSVTYAGIELLGQLKRILQQDKGRHGLVKMTYSSDNCWCPCVIFDENFSHSSTILQVEESEPLKRFLISRVRLYCLESLK